MTKIPTIPSEVERVVLHALAKDPKARFASVRDFAAALEQASQRAYSPTPLIASDQPAPGASLPADFATVVVPFEDSPALAGSVAVPETPLDGDTPAGLVGNPALTATAPAAPFMATTPVAEKVPLLPVPAHPRQRRTIAGLPAALLIGLAVLVVAGGLLGSLALLAHFGASGTGERTISPVRGGTWMIGCACKPDSFIPNGSSEIPSSELDQALYLPLFYGDAQGMIHPGAANIIPTVQNGGISTDATIWTFHLRSGLVWSDGQPYDARDVDYTWKLWRSPLFEATMANNPIGLQVISSAVVSSDHLTITFHLKRPYAPFLQYWVDGGQAPLPAHHFSTMTSEQILKSPDNLNPQVVSGPFLMAESVSGNHFTLVRNPRYYLANRGFPYLNKVVFRILSHDAVNQGLQANTIDSTSDGSLDEAQLQNYKRLHDYTFVATSANVYFEALFFNFRNTVLSSHREVRQAIAWAIDYQSLIHAIPGQANQQCTDHSSFYHPGYDPYDPCPIYDPAAANQLLDNNGWVRGSDGVRTKAGQRLEFEYALPISPFNNDRLTREVIIQHNLQAIGIKLDIQNYPEALFFTPAFFLGKTSPPTGALAGRYDIAEFAYNFGYDPDDSSLFACDQIPPNGGNLIFYCNPTLDSLFKQELATPDPGARQNIFTQIHSIYLTEFPIVVLFGSRDIYMMRKGTHNFQPEPDGAFSTSNIWEWWCDGGKC